jgi:hypothetical protein
VIAERIGLKQCFHLRSGEVIRVKSVSMKTVLCDLFDTYSKRWVPLPVPVPTWAIYAPCSDPSRISPAEVGIIRCWLNNRLRGWRALEN